MVRFLLIIFMMVLSIKVELCPEPVLYTGSFSFELLQYGR
jgi:hypothetical protein